MFLRLLSYFLTKRMPPIEVEIPVWKEFRPFLSGHKHFDIRNLKVASEKELERVQRNVDRARAAQKKVEEATGIEVPINLNQGTGLKAHDIDMFLARKERSTLSGVKEALDEQSEQVYKASAKTIADIAESEPAGIARGKAVEASTAELGARRAAQQEAASPLYERAFQKQIHGVTEHIDLSALSNGIKSAIARLAPFGDDVIDEARELMKKAGKHSDEMLAKTGSRTAEGSPLEEASAEFRGDIQRKLAKLRKESKGKRSGESEIVQTLDDILNRIERAGGNLKQLHYVKLHIDELLKKTGTDGSLESSTKKQLAIVQKKLVEELRKQSPDYAKGWMNISVCKPGSTSSSIRRSAQLRSWRVKMLGRQGRLSLIWKRRRKVSLEQGPPFLLKKMEGPFGIKWSGKSLRGGLAVSRGKFKI